MKFAIGKWHCYVVPYKMKRKHDRVGKQDERDLKFKIIEKYGNVCECCGNSEGTMNIHHVVSKYEGGKDNRSNVIICCPDCHHLMHNNPYFALQQYTKLGKYDAILKLEQTCELK